MNIARGLTILLLAAIPTAAVVADDKIDPATLTDKVTIKLGKKLLVQFEQKGKALTKPKEVEKAADQPPTLSLDFSKNGDNLMLITKNPFPKALKFRALARLKGHKDYFETSVVPVESKLFSAELWQDPIEELVLFDFKLQDGD